MMEDVYTAVEEYIKDPNIDISKVAKFKNRIEYCQERLRDPTGYIPVFHRHLP